MSREVLRKHCKVARSDVIVTIEPKILNIQGIMHAKVIDLPRVLIYSTANLPDPEEKADTV